MPGVLSCDRGASIPTRMEEKCADGCGLVDQSNPMTTEGKLNVKNSKLLSISFTQHTKRNDCWAGKVTLGKGTGYQPDSPQSLFYMPVSSGNTPTDTSSRHLFF